MPDIRTGQRRTSFLCSYVENNKQRVQSVNDVSVDDLLTLYLKDGTVTAKVINIDNV